MRHRPDELADIVTEEDFKKSQAYNLDKSRFGFIESFYKQIETVLMLHYDALPKMWNFSGDLLYKISGYSTDYEILHSLVFLIIFTIFSTVTSTPFNYYSTFVVEQKHGFNKQTVRLFFVDIIKMQFVMAALMFPFISAFLWIIKATGEKFYFYVWVIA